MAFALFLCLFRFEVDELPARVGAACGLAAALAGAGMGAVAGGALRKRSAGWAAAAAVAAVALWCWWAAAQEVAPLTQWYVAAALGVGGFALLGAASAAGPADVGARRASGIALGMAFGSALCSAGLVGSLGVRAVVGAAVGLASVGTLWAWRAGGMAEAGGPEGAEPASSDSATRLVSVGLLAAAAAAAGVGLLRAYEPAVRSLAYGASDLGLACFAGVFAYLRAGKGRAPGLAATVLGAVGCVLISLLCGLSFVAYPDVVMSESAALQTPSSLLVPGRVFPLWLLALCLGLCAGPAWAAGASTSGPGRRAGAFLWLCAAAGAAAEALAAGSYRAAHVLPTVLAVLAAGAACLEGRRREGGAAPGERILALGALVLGAAGVAWALVCDPHLGWAGLRRSAEQYLVPGEAPSVTARVDEEGLAGSFVAGDRRGEFVNGDLVYATAPSSGADALVSGADALASGADAPVGLTIALGLAFAGPAERVAVVGPESSAVVRETERLAEGARVTLIAAHERAGADGFDVIISGPGPLSAPGDPLRLFSRERLSGLRDRLTERGALSIWFPAGRVEMDVLRRALATLQEVFPRSWVFLSGEEAVFVATANSAVPFARLQRMQGHLVDAGFWEPGELLVPFVGEGRDLEPLARAAAPYRLSHPGRPPALARDLSGMVRPASMAALLQYRLRPQAPLLEWVAFRSDAQRLVELHGFAGLYAEQTREALHAVGRAGARQPDELTAFLNGPLVRLDLFGPEAEGREVGMAGALYALGMPEAAAKVLKATVAGGVGTFAVRLRLAQVLEELNQRPEALREYREALKLQPDSPEARSRMVGLLLSMAAYSDAATALGQTVAKEPNNVGALVALARLYAGPVLNRPKEAAELAGRALALDPGNREAEDILMLCAPPGGEGGGRSR